MSFLTFIFTHAHTIAILCDFSSTCVCFHLNYENYNDQLTRNDLLQHNVFFDMLNFHPDGCVDC